MNTEAVASTGTTVPIEIRRSTAQLVRLLIGQYWWVVPTWVVAVAPTALARSEWPNAWFLALSLVLAAAVMASDVPRRRKEVLLLTAHGLYAGRDDGKKLGWLGPRPIQLAWDDIRQIRLTDNRFSRKVIIDTTTFPRLLTFPMSTWFNPDPELEARVELMRRTWETYRGPLPPPPTPSAIPPAEPV